jgi:hypothetical protein
VYALFWEKLIKIDSYKQRNKNEKIINYLRLKVYFIIYIRYLFEMDNIFDGESIKKLASWGRYERL